ncbi:KH domain-containing protein [Candidatus Viridilinea mediisalina]|uniref:RNA helicase n=1 Tax=Candidatus Viridilinea mediisalina TaxID=2024553 RepID=A0A2A6RJZ3_9CHLR|nr:KH domain-containing protein [Candidatus Viridilinea mediisalina]PDW03190.1 hypothetical protein CJ255_10025 [Candidatus Viridilinea mediisalina]
MAREWFTECPDCGRSFGFADAVLQQAEERGEVRPERCAACSAIYRREVAHLGQPTHPLPPQHPLPATGLRGAELGYLQRRYQEPKPQEQTPQPPLDRFALREAHVAEICALCYRHQVLVLVAPTGSGKSTLLPYRLMQPPTQRPAEPFAALLPPEGLAPQLFTRHGPIIVTQPRIQATRQIPSFVAHDLHGASLGAGFDVGFQHSGQRASDRHNRLIYMTDGTLLNLIVRDELERVGTIIIDEAHERSLNIDLILSLLRPRLRRFPHLRLLILSATIEPQDFVQFFGGPADLPLATVQQQPNANAQLAAMLAQSPVGCYMLPEQRAFPLEVRFRQQAPLPEELLVGRMYEEVANTIFDLLLAMHQRDPATPQGDILAFLPGRKPIERAIDRLRDLLHSEADYRLAARVDIFPLYATLPQTRQAAALRPSKDKRRIRVVIATNVAETSLTVEGIVHVVDSGLINQASWDAASQTTAVVPTLHSQAGCRQRWGRAGRTQPGVAHCLYTKEQFADFATQTPPEIARAPLEPLVLSAKAAGVDDLAAFAWLHAPPADELARATRALQLVGALDDQEDITPHGSELRTIADEPEIANLMLLADRFGCAVEMATILPMRRLDGYASLLQWDREWDAATKRAVRRIHQGLIGPCRDDVEFALKLWMAWEGSGFGRSKERERLAWAEQFFVNHTIFSERLVRERDLLLHNMAVRRRNQQLRPCDLGLLDRLRIVITYGLSHQIYQTETQGDERRYRLYLRDAALASDQSNELELSPNSICFGQPPTYFVCGKRQRARKRMTPLAAPLSFTAASFLSLVEAAWLPAVGGSHLGLARLIANTTRDANGLLQRSTNPAWLFIDQRFPVGSRIRCSPTHQGTLRIHELEAAAPPLRPNASSELIEDPDDIELLASEEALGATLGSREIKVTFASSAPASAAELFDNDGQESTSEPSTALLQDAPLPHGRMLYGQPPATQQTFSAIVAGYDQHQPHQPIVLFTPLQEPSPFAQFQARYREGQSISVEVQSIERYINDGLFYLIVREPVSGLEITLDPYDYSLSGRNVAVELLASAPPRTQLQVVVEEINSELEQVRVNRLAASQQATAALVANGERVVSGQIVDVRDNGIFVWIEPEQTEAYLPVILFVHVDRLPPRADEFNLGQRCRLRMQARRFQRPLRISLDPEDLPGKERKALVQRLGPNWDEASQALITDQPLSYARRRELLELSNHVGYRRKLNILFRRSNELEVRVIDVSGLELLRPYAEDERPVPVTIAGMHNDLVFVRTHEGYEAPIQRREISSAMPQLPIALGQQLEVRIREFNPEEGRVQFTLRSKKPAPRETWQLVLQVNPEMVFRMIGKGGAVIKAIRSQSEVQRIDLEKDDAGNSTGRVTIIGASQAHVERAHTLINQHVLALVVSPAERSNTPAEAPPRRTAQQSKTPQRELNLTPAQLSALTRKSGGLFSSLFGGGKSKLETIQAQTSTQITPLGTSGRIRITGTTMKQVHDAVAKLNEAINR